MIKEKLQTLGFSEKEVGVYLALIEMGSAIASDIAKKAGINRSTTYVILESLAGRGLVSVTDRRDVKLYNSTPPEQLTQYLQGMARHYAGLADTAKELLPALKSSRLASVPAPKVQLFEGAEGVKTVFEDTLASLEEMRVYAAFESADRAGSGSQMRLKTIVLDTPKNQERATANKTAARERLSTEINIYDDRVVFISAAENFALVVESQELADALKKALATSSHETRRVRSETFGLAHVPAQG